MTEHPGLATAVESSESSPACRQADTEIGRKIPMNTQLRTLLLAVATTFALLIPTGASVAAADAASGTLTTTSATFNGVRFAGGNTILELTSTVEYTGTFSGTSIVQGTLIFHPNGTTNFHDIETFTGTVNGASGTVTFTLNGRGDSELNIKAVATIIDATGELAGLRGMLAQTAVVLDTAVGPVGTYAGRIIVPGG
jgi:hypothetical protein